MQGCGAVAYVIGIDVGGTFTDAFLADDQGFVTSTKEPSTPPDYSLGVLNCLRELARQMDLTLTGLLANTVHIAHGTTASLNAVLTGTTAKVGFITTRGHRDSIYIMNLMGRYAGLSPEEIQDFVRTNKPAPLLPKRLAKEVTERVDYKGEVIVPLNEEEVRRVVQELLAAGVEAIAVSLLWSFRNPLHERRVREVIAEMAPGLYVGLSSEVSPRIREYPRSATTVINSQVGPILRGYLVPLVQDLQGQGLRGPLLIMQGSGGTIAAADAPQHAVTTLGSVLAGGVIGSVYLSSMLGHHNIITTDVGGTTFLVGLVVEGKPVISTTMVLNQYTINTPMARVRSIGSGGGAIAWVDHGSHLRVGPKSAGAVPGPACYAQGGSEPTVTDADVVLGIINPDFFLGGRMRLDRERARAAIDEKVARPLGLGVVEAAAAIFSIQNAQTADLVRKAVVEAGYDPRDFVMYAFGGAGPTHCFAYGGELGVREILVPMGMTAAAFSAMGLASSDIVLSRETSEPANFPVPAATVNRIFARLERDIREWLGSQGVPFAGISCAREIDIRYTLQVAEIATPVRAGLLTSSDVHGIAEEFERRYEMLYGRGSGFREAGIQFITYRVFGTGHLPFKPVLPRMARASSPASVACKGKRLVFLDPRRGWESTGIYDYQELAYGHELEGPAIVEAPATTVVIPAHTVGRVDPYGNMVLCHH